jgi:DNA polymerase-3 subunit chi
MNVIFWLLSEHHQAPKHAAEANVSARVHYACVLAADLFRQQKKIQVGVMDQEQAHVVDEWLWQFEADRFIPHNLPGEGPHYGTPVEINWEASRQRRGCFVNICDGIPDYFTQLKGLTEWHDFVPADEAGKKAARERYKQLKQAGYQVVTQDIPESVV